MLYGIETPKTRDLIGRHRSLSSPPKPPSVPKSHHFVPQMHSRRFTDAKGRFHLHNKRAGKTYPSTPKAAFAETHLYTKEDAFGAKDTSLEGWFSAVEGAANSIIEKIVTAVRANTPLTLTDAERADWDRYVYLLWKRTPDALAKVATLKDADARLTELFSEIAARGPAEAAEVAKLDNPAERKRLVQGSKVMAIEQTPGEVLKVFASRGLVVLRIVDPQLSFAIGSLPVVRKAGDLRDEASEVWLPIASDVAVGIGGEPGTITIAQVSDAEIIRDINRVTAAQSTSFAAASAPLVEDLAAFVSSLGSAVEGEGPDGSG